MRSIRILIILLIVCILSCTTNMLPIVSAVSIGNAMEGAENFLKKGNQSADEKKILNPTGIYNVLNFIHGMLLLAAITYAVIKGTMIGMKIILGTVAERADAKSMLVPYLWIVAGIAFGEIILREILQMIMKAVD